MGSTSLTTDSSGAPVSEARYLPYGEERWTNEVASPADFGFTSQREEKGFGLYDYNARYYSPVLGRFVSPDSIVPEPAGSQGWNRYSYVINNPIRYTDSTGHCIDPVSGTVCLVVAAKIALEATLLIATVVIVTSEPFQEGASELGQALGDVLIPPAVPREQEGYSLGSLPDPGVYRPGPTLGEGTEYLGGEFTTPLGDANPGLSTETQNTIGLEFPNLLQSKREAINVREQARLSKGPSHKNHPGGLKTNSAPQAAPGQNVGEDQGGAMGPGTAEVSGAAMEQAVKKPSPGNIAKVVVAYLNVIARGLTGGN